MNDKDLLDLCYAFLSEERGMARNIDHSVLGKIVEQPDFVLKARNSYIAFVKCGNHFYIMGNECVRYSTVKGQYRHVFLSYHEIALDENFAPSPVRVYEGESHEYY